MGMKKPLSELLSGLFSVAAGSASIAALPSVSPTTTAAFVAIGMIAAFYKCALAHKDATNFTELDGKVNRPLRQTACDVQDLIRVLDLPTDGVGPGESPFVLIGLAIKQAQAETQLSLEELKKSFQTGLEALLDDEAVQQRLAAALLDETNGIGKLLKRDPQFSSDQLEKLRALFAQQQAAIAEQIQRTQHYPRLSLPLRAYSQEGPVMTRLYYGGRRVTLVGREMELERLHAFLNPAENADISTRDLRWWLWTGPAGVGKSRLGLELCLQAILRGYQAGFWDRSDDFQDWDRWTVDRPTLVVVDYVASRAEQIRDGIGRLYQHPEHISQPLRFLLLERTADEHCDDWYRRFLSRESSTSHLAMLDCRHEEPVDCRVLKNDDVWRIFEEVFSEHKFKASREEVLPLYRKLDPQGRPLLVAAAAEAIVHAHDVQQIRDWSTADLVKNIVEREVDRWRSNGIDEAHVNALVYATVTGGCSKDELDEQREAGCHLPEQFQRDWLRQMSGYAAQGSEQEIQPLEPDLLGEWFLLERLAGRLDMGGGDPERDLPNQTKRLLLASAEEHRSESYEFLQGVMDDFADHSAIEDLLTSELEDKLGWQCAMLRIDRGNFLKSTERIGDAPDQFTRAIEIFYLACVPSFLKISSYLLRAFTYRKLGQLENALSDLSIVIDDRPDLLMVQALEMRGTTYRQLGPGYEHQAVNDFSAIVNLPEVLSEDVARALIFRSEMYGLLEEFEKQIDDYGEVIKMDDVPIELKADALVDRGILYTEQGRTEEAIADFSSAVEMPDVPSDRKASCLARLAVLQDLELSSRCNMLAEARQLALDSNQPDLEEAINELGQNLGCPPLEN
jgi:tetratricopeptide (TPR) repeat protein